MTVTVELGSAEIKWQSERCGDISGSLEPRCIAFLPLTAIICCCPTVRELCSARRTDGYRQTSRIT
ncbi:hypothetical protein ILYODFUR_032269, partial [Ilyodon furcidens]